MTTFHEPQPQSRRAVRQNERAETSGSGFVPFPPNQAATAPNYFADPNAPRDMWDTTARRAAQPPAAPRTETPTTSGRRAAAAPQPEAEPLTYTTQGGNAPVFEAPAYQPAPPAAQPVLPPTEAIQEQPAYRVRDFSPEGRRAARAAEAAPSFPAPTDLEYHTEARAPQPIAPAPQPTEQTLTRRELRAMQHVEPDAADAPASYPAPQAAYPLVTPPAPEYRAPAEVPTYQPPAQEVPAYQPPAAYEAPAYEIPAYEAPAYEAPTYEAPAAYEPPAEQAPAFQAPAAPPQAPPAEQPSAFEALFQAQPPAAEAPLPLVAPEPSTNTAMTNALAEFDALTAAPAPAAAQQQMGVESTWTPPAGHWSAQLDADDDPFETTLSRSIGSGHTATNALVLPGMPKETDIRGPLTSTGEVMLTGSIDLPRSLASTGATARMEHDGIDTLFDANDAEINSTDSSPVRAIRAVSTHNSGHGVTHTQKPKGTKALTALLIAASSMAVVVAGLLIAAFAFNVF
ncbi:hypothetical protein PYV02_06650 [Leifsonia sp. H3M29-4]|uniref:hypothetical protein n=1 Tax=Salinibacterium metalliresistens TaxID=3031321 RepID=UPI0023DC2292|nr:hypothetical protein [Salinibacterium metalliresistens]MDF1478763.1 hypothetical protein [Salinibacterium metalliresistens]